MPGQKDFFNFYTQFCGWSFLFRRATLSQSQIDYFNSQETHIQIGDESEFMQDNPKNSYTLRISNATF